MKYKEKHEKKRPKNPIATKNNQTLKSLLQQTSSALTLLGDVVAALLYCSCLAGELHSLRVWNLSEMEKLGMKWLFYMKMSLLLDFTKQIFTFN